jgi:hypothetical protein
MITRAVSAGSLLTPLAVLVPLLATLVGAGWAWTISPPLVVPVAIGGLTLTVAAGRRHYGIRVPLLAATWTLLATPVALFLWVAVILTTSICGKNVDGSWTASACIAGAIVFFALGSFGLRSRRATGIVPMALLAGVLTVLLVWAVAPGSPGYCD